MHLSVSEILGYPYLAGATAGLAARSKVLATIQAGLPAPILFLDFGGVLMATASFLREFVFGLRESVRTERPEVQLVVANPDPRVEEELRLVARAMNTAIVACEMGADAPRHPRLVGVLDPALRRTMDLLIQAGEADAAALQAASSAESALGSTAWNNRLAALKERGLVLEQRQDRRKVFRPIIGGLALGH